MTLEPETLQLHFFWEFVIGIGVGSDMGKKHDGGVTGQAVLFEPAVNILAI